MKGSCIVAWTPVTWGFPLSASETVEYTFDVTEIQRRHLRYRRQDNLHEFHKYIHDVEWVSEADKNMKEAHVLFPDEHDWQDESHAIARRSLCAGGPDWVDLASRYGPCE